MPGVGHVNSSTKITNAFTTYSATGNREDLSNSIYNIDPFDTPVMSSGRRRNVKNRWFDWQVENLPVVDAGNAQPEGFVLNPNLAQPTVRQQGVAQISERDATVSGTQEEADAAGKSSEMAHQMAMAAKVLKSDMETIMCSRQGRQDGSDTGPVARKTESIPHWLGRAIDKNGIGSNNVGGTSTSLLGGCCVGVVGAAATSGLPTLNTDAMTAPGTPVQIAESMLGDAMQKAYSNGASPTLMVLPPGCKRTASTFVGRSTTQVLVGKTEVVSTVDIFATDFGRVKAIPSRWVPADVGLLLDPDYFAVAFYRSFRQYLMARTGDAETRMIVVEWGIEMRNPMAHSMFNGIKP